jgi:hypothetical protein
MNVELVIRLIFGCLMIVAGHLASRYTKLARAMTPTHRRFESVAVVCGVMLALAAQYAPISRSDTGRDFGFPAPTYRSTFVPGFGWAGGPTAYFPASIVVNAVSAYRLPLTMLAGVIWLSRRYRTRRSPPS